MVDDAEALVTIAARSKDVGGAESCARTHPRVRVLLSAKISTTTEEIDVKVRDLSLGGAMVQGRGLPKVGTDIILSRGSFEIFARIVWCKGEVCGIEFDDPLSNLEELLHACMVQEHAAAPVPTPKYRPLASVPLKTEDMEIARAWAFPAGRQAFLD